MRSRQALQKPRVSNFLPRKGTETFVNDDHVVVLVSNFLPRKGTETINFGFSFIIRTFVSNFLPRKGTETLATAESGIPTMVSKYLPRKGTETMHLTMQWDCQKFQNIYPARGRKREGKREERRLKREEKMKNKKIVMMRNKK
jgi:hypothetical protein